MEKYKQLILEAENSFSEEDLHIGKKLADGCYNKHIGYEFSKESLSNSKNVNDISMYEFFNTTKNEFWNKIRSIDTRKQELYMKALYEFCSYLGYD